MASRLLLGVESSLREQEPPFQETGLASCSAAIRAVFKLPALHLVQEHVVEDSLGRREMRVQLDHEAHAVVMELEAHLPHSE